MKDRYDFSKGKRVGEDDLERYALGTLPPSARAKLEEHLLICESCRDSFEGEDEYLAAAKLRASGSDE
jgi:hypothetical protein